MKRGEVWWTELPAPAGKRPVLLLSRDEAYAVRDLVTIAPLTTRIRRIPSEVPLGPKDGVPKACVANLDIMTTIPKNSLTSYMATLAADKMRAVDEALCFALGLAHGA